MKKIYSKKLERQHTFHFSWIYPKDKAFFGHELFYIFDVCLICGLKQYVVNQAVVTYRSVCLTSPWWIFIPKVQGLVASNSNSRLKGQLPMICEFILQNRK